MDAMRTKILLINDDPARAAAVRQALIDSTNGVFQVESTASCSEALDRLTREGAQYQQKTIAAVLVDLALPDSRGIDTIDRLLHALRIPILVLSAPQDQGAAKLAVKQRAQESSAE
jgi:CheY-like chemotaxis protein